MKKYFIALIIIIVNLLSEAKANDDSGNLVYPNNFNLSIPLKGGKIPYFNAPVNVTGSFGFTMSGLYTSYLRWVETHIGIINGYGFDGQPNLVWSTGGPSFGIGDFIDSNGTIQLHSKIKNFNVTIPNVFNFDTGGYRLVIFYKYNFDHRVGLPNLNKDGVAPQDTHGIPWFISGTKQFSFVKDYPISTITGPKVICDEGIYTITNVVYPGQITLDQPDSIATLTHIGNNQWKITKIGEGKIKIVSTLGPNVVKKEISLGARNDLGTFRVSPRIMGVGTYYIYYEDPEEMINPVANWTISSTSNNVQIFPDGPDKAVIHINSWNSNQLSANSITVTAVGTTVCGDNFFREIAIAGGAEILDPDL
ncbi:hypothetical protein [Sphingobacterium hotanense]|uniref:hypothetical protein n=1 Tax=Sphingobacterium hotanense TaxID=649196 RepID=UPI0011F0D881|nr:hypothetical protein [Sphingobacterium hotanense]